MPEQIVQREPASQPRQKDGQQALSSALTGAVFVLIQFDVCEEIQLGRLGESIRGRTVAQPSMKHPAPAYIRYQRPPVV
jgi:hypothetical protein